MANFIPKTYKKEQITVRLDIDTLSALDDVSRKNNLSRSELINQCIDFALRSMATEKTEG